MMNNLQVRYRFSLKPAGNFCLGFVALCAMIACADALPKYERQSELSEHISAAEDAALRTRGYAGETRNEALKSEQLLKEARELSARALLAESNCQTLVKKIPKAKPKSEQVVEVQKAAEPPKPPPVPEYSASDAPLKKPAESSVAPAK